MICHNRMIHSLKVGQLARCLAEYLNKQYFEDVFHAEEHIDVNIVEAACLAHDLGHPPFGHTGEKALRECYEEAVKDVEPFEGNAQTFRILTCLAVRSDMFNGLDLTRGTLNAILKYPWSWEQRQSNKWGYYEEDAEEFEWARAPLSEEEKGAKTVEAEVMDLADEISYAIHDVEDFFRAGFIPLERMVMLPDASDPTSTLTDEGESFISDFFERKDDLVAEKQGHLREVFRRMMENVPVSSPYHELDDDRASLRSWESHLIGKYIQKTKFCFDKPPGKRVVLSEEMHDELMLMKRLTSHYVIHKPSLRTQQKGQKRLIRKLFTFFYEELDKKNKRDTSLPPRCREVWRKFYKYKGWDDLEDKDRARLAADAVAGMTEPEALDVAHKLMGISPGSAFDPVY